MNTYEIFINDDTTPDTIIAKSPREALEIFAIGEQDVNNMFVARSLRIESDKSVITYQDLEYVVEDNSLYFSNRKIERTKRS
jgi:hypothetical protein